MADHNPDIYEYESDRKTQNQLDFYLCKEESKSKQKPS